LPERKRGERQQRIAELRIEQQLLSERLGLEQRQL